MGLAVFPIAGKVPITAHGELDASTSSEVIDSWWAKRPESGVALSLRFTSFFVLDVDRRKFGDETLRALECEYGSLPHTATVLSGSSNWSWHLYFNRPASLAGLSCRALRVRGLHDSGIDVKGVMSGYVGLPPSLHASGHRYCWEASSRIGEVAIADPPAWLIDLVISSSRCAFRGKYHTESVEADSFFLGWLFKRSGMLGPEIRPGVWAVRCPNEHRHSPGKTSLSSTVIFAPEEPGGRGTFFCSHTSFCSDAVR